jgi:hypothetical protein
MLPEYPFYVSQKTIPFYDQPIDYYPPHGIAVEKLLILLDRLIEELPEQERVTNVLDNLDIITKKMEEMSKVIATVDRDSEETQEYFNWFFKFIKNEGISVAYYLVQECFPGLDPKRLKKEDFILLINVALQDVMKIVR